MKYIFISLLLLAGIVGKCQEEIRISGMNFGPMDSSWTLPDGRLVSMHLINTRVSTTDPPQYHNVYAYDTLVPTDPFKQIVFLMQENMRLSQRLDKLERQIDSLNAHPLLRIDWISRQLVADCRGGGCSIIVKDLGGARPAQDGDVR